ncbi:hypothetical protein B6U81_05970 [Thermoplasmatales archaeon ex4484_30]|nr:MAG: hypothetical protein B6U81_05970 [Thermoplasmatales archaeon ex4484_30]RLF46004.1 MAG: hypothetical protein DRN29_05705 [Thermoplasmata archaeon]
MECKMEENLQNCNCTWEGCNKKGKCCECLRYHWERRELPACLFPKDVEATYDRSLEKFIEIYGR